MGRTPKVKLELSVEEAELLRVFCETMQHNPFFANTFNWRALRRKLAVKPKRRRRRHL